MIDSGVEIHNALGAGETYHKYIRQTDRKVRVEHPTVPADHALSLPVHAMNCTDGPNGLALSLLVFGIVPRMQMTPADLPEQREIMKASQKALSEMAKHISRSRLRRARRNNVLQLQIEI